MSGDDIPNLGWYIVGAGTLFALLFVGAGLVAIVRRGLALKAHVERYGDLPILDVIERTQDNLAGTSARVAALPSLVQRARAAVAEIDAARARVIASLTSPAGVAKLLGVIFR